MTLAIVALFGIGVGFAQEMQVLGQVKKEIVSLENGAGDVWDYSGSGGYVFQFSQDVLGDGAPESFVNVSVRPNVWHVFTGSDAKNYIGDVEISGSGFLLNRDGQSATLMDTYQANALEKYVIEQKITPTRIQKTALKVGEGATEKEYQTVLDRQTSENTSWVTPKMEGILLYDLLNHSSPKWFEFDPDKAQVRNGYYRLPGDENRISSFESAFTPKVALEALNQKLGTSRPIEKEAAATSSSPAQTVPVPATPTPPPVEKSTPLPTASPIATPETKSAPSGFPVVPVAIIAAVIVGILIFILRRKST